MPRKKQPATRAGLEFYRGEDNLFWWRLRAANGNIVATSPDGYSRISKAEQGFNALRDAVLALPGKAENVSVTPRSKSVRKLVAKVTPAAAAAELLERRNADALGIGT